MTRRWIGPVVIAAMLVFAAVVYSSLPERMPTHWNVRGDVDGWSSRLWGALLAPLVSAGVWVLLPVLRRMDPRRRNYDRFEPTFWLLVNLLIVFFAGIHVMTLGVALGWAIDMTRAILVTVGLVIAVLGNYLPRLRSNWWLGIRTPWTLESDAVWRSTHRLAGYTFVIGGLATAASALLPSPVAIGVAMAAIMTAAIAPAIYSYVAYQREHREAAQPESSNRMP
jgi:uncharacterized membrane protein